MVILFLASLINASADSLHMNGNLDLIVRRVGDTVYSFRKIG